MNVTVAKSSGFCSGVQHAVDTAMRVESENVYLLGELIHNPSVTDAVRARGIITVESVDEVPQGATLILRSHGVGRLVYEACTQKGIRIIDCTCPFVRHTQEIVRNSTSIGKTVLVIGEKTHPEVIGLCGWGNGRVLVLEDENADLSSLLGQKIVVVAQTTCSEEKFKKFFKILKKFVEKQLRFSKQFVILLRSVRRKQQLLQNRTMR